MSIFLFIRIGTVLMVLTLFVISSPTTPLPRVAARLNTPFSYLRDTDNPSILARFDSTYEDSTYIKSMKYSEEKGFGTYSKVLSSDMVYDLVTYTKNKIDSTVNEILEGDFSINPKVYNQENISCRFCTFKDLCYFKEKDITYLDKVEDLSFISGGDE